MGRSTTAGAEALAQGMEQNSWLEELDLSKNRIKMLGTEPWWLGEEPPLIDGWYNLNQFDGNSQKWIRSKHEDFYR